MMTTTPAPKGADIEPCPFCGGAAKVEKKYIRGRVIECEDCGASVGAHDLPRGIAMWNRRAMRSTSTSQGTRTPVKLSPELKAALDKAAETGATIAETPEGIVFINRGHDYGDNAHLECAACGGSGHIEDQKLIAGNSGAAPGDALDAARLEVFIDWYLRGGSRSEIHLYGHMMPTTREIVLAWLDRSAIAASTTHQSTDTKGKSHE